MKRYKTKGTTPDHFFSPSLSNRRSKRPSRHLIPSADLDEGTRLAGRRLADVVDGDDAEGVLLALGQVGHGEVGERVRRGVDRLPLVAALGLLLDEVAADLGAAVLGRTPGERHRVLGDALRARRLRGARLVW